MLLVISCVDFITIVVVLLVISCVASDFFITIVVVLLVISCVASDFFITIVVVLLVISCVASNFFITIVVVLLVIDDSVHALAFSACTSTSIVIDNSVHALACTESTINTDNKKKISNTRYQCTCRQVNTSSMNGSQSRLGVYQNYCEIINKR